MEGVILPPPPEKKPRYYMYPNFNVSITSVFVEEPPPLFRRLYAMLG